MADYILREVAVKIAERYGLTHGSVLGRHSGIADCIASEIEAIPAADVVEAVHGKWFWADDGYCRCSECTQKAPLVQPLDDEPEAVMTKYCPNCGAKMDGRKE